MKKLAVLVMVFGGTLFVASNFFTAGTASAAGPVVLKAVAAWPLHVLQNNPFHEFIKVFNEKAKAKGVPLVIDKKGGPEVVPTMQQFEAMRAGIVDLVYTPTDYFAGECIEGTSPSVIRPEIDYYRNAIRQTKLMDLINTAYRKKSGVRFLAILLTGQQMTLLSTKAVNGADWSGLKVRSFGTITSLGIEKLGGSSVFIPSAEVFTALQRGTIDGIMGAAMDRLGFGERKIYKYYLKPGFFLGTGGLFISTKVWDSLPENAKAFIGDICGEMEDWAFSYLKGEDEAAINTYVKEDGVQVVTLSPEDQKKTGKAFRESYLEYIVQKSPEFGAKLNDLLKGYVY